MGITLHLQQISSSTLEILETYPQQSELILELIESVQDMTESEFYTSDYKEKFAMEWETPELDLHKYFEEINYLLAGYAEHYSGIFSIPELQARKEMDFLIIQESEADSLPLINLVWFGKSITQNECRWYQTPEEVILIRDGLLKLSKSGFQSRFISEKQSAQPNPLFFDWEEEELLDWLTDYYGNLD